MTEEEQRKQIQAEVDKYFGRGVQIRPRAMAALQGRWVDDWDGESVVTALSVFEALLSVSPSSLTSLFEAGIPVERLSSTIGHQGIGHLAKDTLRWMFQGNYEDDFCSEMCPAGDAVRTSGNLDEIHLLQAFLQTAYRGPVEFSEKVELQFYTTDVGDRLIDAGFIDMDSVEETLDGEGSYRAKSHAAQKFLDTADRLSSIQIIDPSHDLFQYTLWLDSKGRVRIRPFGVGKLGNLAPSYLRNGASFVYREGIFQSASVGPALLDDDSISIFEDMINSQKCSEREFEDFFEKHPQFLVGIDYKQVHAQLVLHSEDRVDLIPDFMLEPMSSIFCDLLELKVPYYELVARLRRGSRARFRAFVNEAIAQLVEYRRYFDSKNHRKSFHARYGLEAYYPKMVLVIGRRTHFKDDAERQDLTALLPKDLAIWTYDDLLNRARRFRAYVTRTRR